jgi:hypothetical protein
MADYGHADDTLADAVNVEYRIYLVIVKGPDFTTAKIQTDRS